MIRVVAVKGEAHRWMHGSEEQASTVPGRRLLID